MHLLNTRVRHSYLRYTELANVPLIRLERTG